VEALKTVWKESQVGERSQHGHGSYWTKTISATCYGKKIFIFLFLHIRSRKNIH
jgi:hypothetical protein